MSPGTYERRPIHEAPSEGFGRHQAASPTSQSTAEQAIGAVAVRDGWKARRSAGARLPALLCGSSDPWTCRCHRRPAPDADLTAAVAVHLMATTGSVGVGHDLAAVRALWRRGGPAARLAERINSLGGAA